MVNVHKQYVKHSDLAKTIIDTDKPDDCFMKNYDDLLINSVKFNLMLNVVWRLECLKSQFCISNVLAHLLFCNRSPDNSDKCKHCSRHYVDDATDFSSSIKYYLTSIFTNKFEKDLKLLFGNAEVRRLNLVVLYWSEAYHALVELKLSMHVC